MPEIRNDDDGRLLSTHFPASQEAVDLLLSQPINDDGRSEWRWVRLANGDLILGLFPQGEAYFELEGMVAADLKRAEVVEPVTIAPGTIVTPQGDGERIIGIVLDTVQPGYPLVFWLSDFRGAFLCYEAVGDVDIADLSQREGVNDQPVDHEALAAAILALGESGADSWAALSPEARESWLRGMQADATDIESEIGPVQAKVLDEAATVMNSVNKGGESYARAGLLALIDSGWQILPPS